MLDRQTSCFRLFAALSFALPLATADLFAQDRKPDDRPNILIILCDDLGYSDLGCYGGELDTPNIDALAEGGVRFESFYNSARCCPSRASLMTGLYPPQAGIAAFTTRQPHKTRGPAYLGRLNESCVTLAEVLKPAGYGCYYVGKWHMHDATGPTRRGFDEFYGYRQAHSHSQWDADFYRRFPEGRKKEIDPPDGEFYATDVFNDYAVEFIKQGQKRNKPWFLFLGHSSPHFPVQAPAATVDKFYERYLRGWDVLRLMRFDRMREIGLIDSERWTFTERSIVPVEKNAAIANGYPGKRNPSWESLPEDRRKDLARRMAIFAAMVEHIDRGVARIVAHLKKTGDFDNTLIMLLSDNGACYEWGPFGFDGTSRRAITKLHEGEELRQMGGPDSHHSYGSAWANLGNTPFRLYKHFTHEGGACTPFIAHWPKGIEPKGKWIRERGHLIDVMPTVREVARAPYPATYRGHAIQAEEGHSLLPVWNGGELPERALYFEHYEARAVIEGDYKVVLSKRMPWKLEWELYDLGNDRCETRDLAKENPDLVEQLVAKWTRYAKRVKIHPFYLDK